MILLQRTSSTFGSIDGSSIRPDFFATMSLDQINATGLSTESGIVALREVFDVSIDRMPFEPFLLIDGNCEAIDGLGAEMQSGTLCILGDVGDNTARKMGGGSIVISGNVRDHLGAGMMDGLIYVVGNCRDGLASPLAGRKSGMRGGDILVAGCVRDRACERMRRGTVFIAGNVGDYCAAQMIAGSLVVMGELGREWGGGMRRGSIILGHASSSRPSASLSAARDFELSFLPLIWRHLGKIQIEALEILDRSIEFSQASTKRGTREVPQPFRIPRTRWVQRQIADLNCDGRGEVLVLKRLSSLAYG